MSKGTFNRRWNQNQEEKKVMKGSKVCISQKDYMTVTHTVHFGPLPSVAENGNVLRDLAIVSIIHQLNLHICLFKKVLLTFAVEVNT